MSAPIRPSWLAPASWIFPACWMLVPASYKARSSIQRLNLHTCSRPVMVPRLALVGLHALRNALIPVITVIGLSVGGLMAGAVLTETIFSWPGVGKWLIEAIGRRDYPALQGGVLLVSAIVIFVNVAVDVLYGVINPRIRHGN